MIIVKKIGGRWFGLLLKCLQYNFGTTNPTPKQPRYRILMYTCLSLDLRKRLLIHRVCRLAYFLVTYFMAVRAFSRAFRPSSVWRVSLGSSKYCWNCFTPMHCNTPFVKSKQKLYKIEIKINYRQIVLTCSFTSITCRVHLQYLKKKKKIRKNRFYILRTTSGMRI